MLFSRRLSVFSAGAFQDCRELESVDIPGSVAEIGNIAFMGCSKLERADIPDSVKRIGKLAFFACGLRAGVAIPASAAKIGEGAFSGCPRLPGIRVADENPSYCSVDGVLFDKEKKTLCGYPFCSAERESATDRMRRSTKAPPKPRRLKRKEYSSK